MAESNKISEQITRQTNRLAALTTERARIDPIMRDVRDFIAPRTARFSGEQVNSGSREDKNIINGTARFALRTATAGLISGFTSKIRPWFRLSTPDIEMMEYGSVKLWLYTVENLMRQTLLQSNFYAALAVAYKTMIAYGTAPLSVEEDVKDVVRFNVFPWGTYFIAQDDKLRPDTFYRKFQMTTAQIVEMAARTGAEVSEPVKAAYGRHEMDTWHTVIHVVEPNYGRDGTSLLAKNKKWRSCLFEETVKCCYLEESGFDYFPFAVFFWERNGEEPYGIGCGEIALGDTRAQQLLERRKYQALDKLTDPTMVAVGLNEQKRSRNMPGDIIYASGMAAGGGKPYYPAYEINPHLEAFGMEIQNLERRVEKAFYVPLFQIISGLGDQPNITATQISALRDESMLQLAPIGDNIDIALDHVLEVLFSIMSAKGLLPPVPEELHGVPLKIEYLSIMAQAQKAMGIGALERTAGFVSTIAAVYPEGLDKFDFDQAIDEYGMMAGTPPRLIRDDESVAGVRQARDKQKQQQMALAAAPQLAGAVRDLAQSPIGSDSVLSRAAGLSA